ncbi:MAG TPA: GNAT family N-acetyltransferase [Thermoleophilaceae bacterium]
MKTIELERQDSLSAITAEWDALVRRVGASPFSTPGWFDAWWRAFGRGRLDVFTLRRDRELLAVLPLTERHGLRRALTNWHTPELEIPAVDSSARRALLRGVLKTTRTSLQLAMLTAGSQEAHDFATVASQEGVRILPRTIEYSPYVRLEGSYDDYEHTLAQRRRSELRRRRRRLAERGALTFHVEEGGERLDLLLAEGFAVEGSGWKTEQGTAIVSRPETEAFYRYVGAWAAPRGSLRLAFLRLDGRPIAFHFTIEEGGSAYQLKGGYDPEFRELAPGQLLVQDMIRWAFERGLHTYEFLGADEAFKLDWTASLRQRIALHAFPHSPAGAVAWTAQSYGRPIAKRARDLLRRRP